MNGLEAVRPDDARDPFGDRRRALRATHRDQGQGRSRRPDQVGAGKSRLAATAAGLEQTRAERAFYLASLRREEALTTTQIGRLEEQARAAAAKAQEVSRQAAGQPARGRLHLVGSGDDGSRAGDEHGPATDGAPSTPPPAPVDRSRRRRRRRRAAPAPARPGATMTVSATGYCKRGTTATGLPVGPGIVATDPSVIPLGHADDDPRLRRGRRRRHRRRDLGARIDVWIADCKRPGFQQNSHDHVPLSGGNSRFPSHPPQSRPTPKLRATAMSVATAKTPKASNPACGAGRT